MRSKKNNNQADIVNGEDRSNEKLKWNRLLLLLVNRFWPVVRWCLLFYAQTYWITTEPNSQTIRIGLVHEISRQPYRRMIDGSIVIAKCRTKTRMRRFVSLFSLCIPLPFGWMAGWLAARAHDITYNHTCRSHRARDDSSRDVENVAETKKKPKIFEHTLLLPTDRSVNCVLSLWFLFGMRLVYLYRN